MGKPVYQRISTIIEKRDLHAYSEVYIIAAYVLNCLLSLILTMFFKFHVKLIFTNGTTIESMDKKTASTAISSYNRGFKRNFEQVFGRNPWIWLFPITGESGKPIGDGVIWSDNYQPFDDEAPGNESENRKSSPKADILQRANPEDSRGIAGKVLMSPPLKKINGSFEESKDIRIPSSQRTTVQKDLSTGADSYGSKRELLPSSGRGKNTDSGRPIGKIFSETISSPEI